MNDGTKPFPANPTANTNSFGGCLRDYKNTHFPVVVRVSYIGGILKVSTDTHSRGKKMIPCFEQKDLDLPVGYHFGFSVRRSSLVLVHSSFFLFVYFGLVVLRLFVSLFVHARAIIPHSLCPLITKISANEGLTPHRPHQHRHPLLHSTRLHTNNHPWSDQIRTSATSSHLWMNLLLI